MSSDVFLSKRIAIIDAFVDVDDNRCEFHFDLKSILIPTVNLIRLSAIEMKGIQE